MVQILQQTHSLPDLIIGVLQYGSGYQHFLPVTVTWEIWRGCIRLLIAKHIVLKQLKSPHEFFPEMKSSTANFSSETSEVKC